MQKPVWPLGAAFQSILAAAKFCSFRVPQIKYNLLDIYGQNFGSFWAPARYEALWWSLGARAFCMPACPAVQWNCQPTIQWLFPQTRRYCPRFRGFVRPTRRLCRTVQWSICPTRRSCPRVLLEDPVGQSSGISVRQLNGLSLRPEGTDQQSSGLSVRPDTLGQSIILNEPIHQLYDGSEG